VGGAADLSTPGCHARTTRPPGRCEPCELAQPKRPREARPLDAAARARRAGYDRRRGSPARRGYGAQWRVRRAVFLELQPSCADPAGRHVGEPRRATLPDHIVPLAAGGADDESNWQALCASCHGHKIATHDGGFGRPRKSA